jgi:hypothetical protein
MLITYDISGNELKGQELLDFRQKVFKAIKDVRKSYNRKEFINGMAWQINGLYFANLYRYNHLKIGVTHYFDIIINPSDDDIANNELVIQDFTHDDLVVRLPIRNISVAFKIVL